jgi:cytochrome c5
MSEIHLEEHHSPIQTPKQLIIAVVLAFVVPIAAIVLLTQYLTLGIKLDPGNAVMTPERVAERIRPVGQVAVADAAGGPQAARADSNAGDAKPPAASVAAVPPPASAPAAGVAMDGKGIFEKACAACHMTGAAGAPKAGDKAAWSPRLAAGKDTLYASAINGKGAMPAKGGNASLSDADVKAAVDYLTGLAK